MPTTKINRKRGRPARYVHDRDGKPVVGLSVNSDGKFYATHTQPRVYFGKDYDVAVMQYHAWKDRQSKARIALPEKRKPSPSTKRVLDHFHPDDANDEIVYHHLPPEDIFWSKVRDEFFKSPERFAEKTGIPQFSYLMSIPKPDPSITLAACHDAYLSKRKAVTHEERRKVGQAWTEFTNVVAPANRLQDVTEELFGEWEDAVFQPYQEDDGSPKTVRHKIDRVKRVLNYCMTRAGKDRPNCKRLIDLINMIELPDLNREKPNPISPAEFHHLLQTAQDTFWEPMLVLMLNLCYYPVDARTLTPDAIDFKTGAVVFERRKKKTVRVGILWEITKTALRTWMKDNPPNGVLFTSNYGVGFSSQGLRHSFRRLRDKAGLGEDVTMDRIRDGAYTAACAHPETTEKQCKILAGHKFKGDTDAYVQRDPSMVETCCKAIEAAYFGGEK